MARYAAEGYLATARSSEPTYRQARGRSVESEGAEGGVQGGSAGIESEGHGEDATGRSDQDAGQLTSSASALLCHRCSANVWLAKDCITAMGSEVRRLKMLIRANEGNMDMVESLAAGEDEVQLKALMDKLK